MRPLCRPVTLLYFLAGLLGCLQGRAHAACFHDCHLVLDQCRAWATSRAHARAWWLPVDREKRTEEGSEEDAGPLRNVPMLLLPLLGPLPAPDPSSAGGGAASDSGAAAAGAAEKVPNAAHEADQARLMCLKCCGRDRAALCGPVVCPADVILGLRALAGWSVGLARCLAGGSSWARCAPPCTMQIARSLVATNARVNTPHLHCNTWHFNELHAWS